MPRRSKAAGATYSASGNHPKYKIEDKYHVYWCQNCDNVIILDGPDIIRASIKGDCDICKDSYGFIDLIGTVEEIEQRIGVKKELWEILNDR